MYSFLHSFIGTVTVILILVVSTFHVFLITKYFHAIHKHFSRKLIKAKSQCTCSVKDRLWLQDGKFNHCCMEKHATENDSQTYFFFYCTFVLLQSFRTTIFYLKNHTKYGQNILVRISAFDVKKCQLSHKTSVNPWHTCISNLVMLDQNYISRSQASIKSDLWP